MKCFCCNKNVVKKGKRKTRFGLRQLYYCKNCKKTFTDSKLPYKTYGPKVIGNAISSYNLGNTIKESVKLTNKRFKVKVSESSVSDWLKKTRNICTFHKIRREALKKYEESFLFNKVFAHNDLSYNFRYHKAKLDMLCRESGFSFLKKYVEKFKEGCPKFFKEIENRCSQAKVRVRIKRKNKYNNACRLAKFSLKSCKVNKKRHPTVENFMLINDSSTIACEVPVWLWEKNLKMSISGHIDILQIRGNKIHILDFKPNAFKEKEEKVASQLFWYASGLSFRTSIPLSNFVCAWFDENNYYEFNPKEAKVSYYNKE